MLTIISYFTNHETQEAGLNLPWFMCANLQHLQKPTSCKRINAGIRRKIPLLRDEDIDSLLTTFDILSQSQWTSRPRAR